MQWPEGTPAEVARLADELVCILKGRSGQTVGPALALVFSYCICELGGGSLRQILRDVSRLAQKHRALARKKRPPESGLHLSKPH
jgi:hypothetical protein